VTGDPVRVSACHCLDCKKRSGSAFAVQARWPVDRFRSTGTSKTWIQLADSGNRITHHFCPECGSGLFYMVENKFDGLIAIPLGAFDDPYFVSPKFSVWEDRKNDWVEILGDEVQHSA